MANRSSEYKKVPYSVIVRIFFPQIKYNTYQVKCTSYNNHGCYIAGHIDEECASTNQENTTHPYVNKS